MKYDIHSHDAKRSHTDVKIKLICRKLNEFCQYENQTSWNAKNISGAPAARRAAKRSPISIPYMEI